MNAIPNLVFASTGADFSALYAARDWCRENNYSFGPMSHPYPIAIMRGDAQIAKWKNLTTKERATCDGRIESSDFRNGPVTITITNPHP